MGRGKDALDFSCLTQTWHPWEEFTVVLILNHTPEGSHKCLEWQVAFAPRSLHEESRLRHSLAPDCCYGLSKWLSGRSRIGGLGDLKVELKASDFCNLHLRVKKPVESWLWALSAHMTFSSFLCFLIYKMGQSIDTLGNICKDCPSWIHETAQQRAEDVVSAQFLVFLDMELSQWVSTGKAGNINIQFQKWS